MHRYIVHLCCLTILVLGCQPGATSSGPPPGYGRVAVELVDAPNPQVKEINVTISKVTAHSAGGGWVGIYAGPALTVDLLKLKEYALPLGFANVPAGKVTQIRLYTLEGGVQDVVLADGSHVALKVPSGVQSGIKIKGPFQVNACTTSTVTLDFDGHKSIWVHPTGQGDQWILRPVIHAKKVKTEATPCADPTTPADPTDPANPTTPTNPTAPTNPTTPTNPTNPGDPTDPGSTIDPMDPPILDGGGRPCSSSTSCLSGYCANGICAQGGPGAPCRVGADCSSGTCGLDGLCGAGTAGPTGAACTSNAGCLSGSCVSGQCDVGVQGNPCQSTSDCGTGFVCDSGSCAPVVN